MIKSTKTINIKLIKEHWDDILRLVATIKLKENTASEIFRRLNSYSKQHKLYAALKAFGRIIKSLFITKYIDKVELRQMIKKQLNWRPFKSGGKFNFTQKYLAYYKNLLGVVTENLRNFRFLVSGHGFFYVRDGLFAN